MGRWGDPPGNILVILSSPMQTYGHKHTRIYCHQQRTREESLLLAGTQLTSCLLSYYYYHYYIKYQGDCKAEYNIYVIIYIYIYYMVEIFPRLGCYWIKVLLCSG